MTEEALTVDWALLEPTPHQRRRIERRVFDWLEARETSLAAQWISLVTARPVVGFAYAIASALSLLALTPLSWLTGAVLA